MTSHHGRRLRVERLVPLEHDEAAVVGLDRLRDVARRAGVEVVEAAGVQCRVDAAEVEVGVGPGLRASRHDPHRGIVGLPARAVARRGEVRDAGRRHVVHRLRDDAVLEHRLGRVDHVVDDDVGLEAGIGVRRVGEAAERADVVREVDLAAVRGGKAEPRLRRDVVHDLQHRAAFVGVDAEVALLEDGDGRRVAERIAGARQVAREDVVRRVRPRAVRVVAVGHHADRDATTVDARGQPVDAMQRPAGRLRGADVGVHRARRDHGPDALRLRDRGERGGGHVGLDYALAVGCAGCTHFDARDRAQILEDVRGAAPAVERDAHERPAGLVEDDRMGKLGLAGTAREDLGSLRVRRERLRAAFDRCDFRKSAAQVFRDRFCLGESGRQCDRDKRSRKYLNCHNAVSPRCEWGDAKRRAA